MCLAFFLLALIIVLIVLLVEAVMKTKLLVPCLLLGTALTGCGLGQVKITGTRGELFIRDDNDEYVPVEVKYTKIGKESISYYNVSLSYGQRYLIKIYPTWKGSRKPQFRGDVAEFEKSDYWTISYNEDGSEFNDPEYFIDFNYPPDLSDEVLYTAKYKVNDFEGKLYFNLKSYSVPTDIE